VNVLHIVRDFSPLSQTFIYDLIRNLDKTDSLSSQVLFYRNRMLVEERPLNQVFSCKQVEEESISRLKRGWLKLRGKSWRAVAFSRYIEHQEFELVHCHFAWCLWECFERFSQPAVFGLPMLVSVHGTDISRKLCHGNHLEKFEMIARTPNVYFAATTPYLVNALLELGVHKSKIFTIPNALNPMFLEQVSVSRRLSGDSFKVACNARFVSVKGHQYLVDAFSRFVKEFGANAELTLIGEGENLEKIQQQVRDLGLEQKVRFMGAVPHARIPQIIANQDVYVQPSIKDESTGQVETFGIAALEAIALGVPVVVTNQGGLPYVVGESNRFAHIVSDKSADAIYEKLVEVHGAGDLKSEMRDYSRSRAEQYSQARQLEACCSVYKEILRRCA